MTWNILLISPGREFAVAGALAGFGFTAYLPTIPRVIRRGPERRRVTVDRPLFPGYLFLMRPDARQSLIRSISGVRGYLPSGDGIATLSADAILAVRIAEGDAYAAATTPPQRRFHVGDRVWINRPDHAAHLVEGIIKRLDKSDRAVIEVMSPSLAVAVVTDAAWLEPA